MRWLALMPVALLAACSDEPAKAPAPTARSTPAPRPEPSGSPRPLRPGELPSPELDGAVPLSGGWQGERMPARYVADGRIAFALRCDRAAGRILLSRGVGAGGTLRLFTDNAAATYPAQVVDGAVETAVTTGQTFLDALARADAIGVGVEDGAVVRLPGDKAIGAVVRGCRPAGR